MGWRPPLILSSVDEDVRRLAYWTESRSPRNRAVLSHYLAGEKQIDIAREFDITPSRVFQLVSRFRLRNLQFRKVK